MTRNVFDSLLEAAARLLEKPEPPAATPAPAAEPPLPVAVEFYTPGLGRSVPASRKPAAPKPRLERNLPASAFVLPDDVRDRALALGWTDEHLATLAGLLHTGDRVGTVTPASIEIIRRSGVVQHFYHPTAQQPWRRKLEGASD